MNILSRTLLEVKVGERLYVLEVHPDSPAQEISNVLTHMLENVNKIIEKQLESSLEQENPKGSE